MSRRKTLQAAHEPAVEPPALLAASDVMAFLRFVPARDLEPYDVYPAWFVRRTACRKFQMIARAEWVRLTSDLSSCRAWRFSYPHSDVSPGLRKAACEFARSLI